MNIPAVFERVRVKDRNLLYVVTRVDHVRQVVNLVPLECGHRWEMDVPLAAICLLRQQGPQLARRSQSQ